MGRVVEMHRNVAIKQCTACLTEFNESQFIPFSIQNGATKGDSNKALFNILINNFVGCTARPEEVCNGFGRPFKFLNTIDSNQLFM